MVLVSPTVVYCTAAYPRRLDSFPRAELLRSMTQRRKVTVSLSSVRMGPWAFFQRGLEDGTLATADCYKETAPCLQLPSAERILLLLWMSGWWCLAGLQLLGRLDDLLREEGIPLLGQVDVVTECQLLQRHSLVRYVVLCGCKSAKDVQNFERPCVGSRDVLGDAVPLPDVFCEGESAVCRQ